MKRTNSCLHTAGANAKIPAYEAPAQENREPSIHRGKVENSRTATIGNDSAHRRQQESHLYPIEVKKTNRASITELQGLLERLTALYGAHSSRESVLQTACRLVVDILRLEHCSVGWFDEKQLSIRVLTSHNKEGTDVKVDRVIRAISNFVKKGQPNRYNHGQTFAGLGLDRQSDQAIELIAPLRVDKRIVGYLYGLRPEFVKPGILVTERSLFRTLSQHISTAIEAQRKHQMLDDRQLALGLSRQESEFAATLTARQSLHSVESRELARKIARRFFGDLRAAGFETKHIILVATEILDSVKEALRKAGRKQKVTGAGIQAALVPGGH